MTLGYDRDNSTLREPLEPPLGPSVDAEVQAWQRGARGPSRDLLLRVARGKVSRLMALQPGWDGRRALPVTPLAAYFLNGLLGRLVEDGGATPQIAPLTDGGIEVEWLVHGDSLRIEVANDGQVMIEGIDAAGHVLVEGEMPPWDNYDFVMGQAREWLAKLSERVVFQVPAI